MVLYRQWKNGAAGHASGFEDRIGGREEPGMVQLIAVAAVGGLALYAYSSFKRHMSAIEEEERLSNEKNRSGDLEYDPKSGKYRPKR